MNALGKRIRELRMNKGWTQEELADGICTGGQISQIEVGRANPSTKLLAQLAVKLEVSLKDLISDLELDLPDKSKFALAKALIHSGQPEPAHSLLTQLSDSESPDIEAFDLLRQLGTVYIQTGQYQMAKKLFLELEELALQRNWDVARPMITTSIGYIYRDLGDDSVARYHFERALAEYNKLDVKDPNLYTQILLAFTDASQKCGRKDVAIAYYRDLIRHQSNDLELHEQAKIHLNLSQEYRSVGNYKEALNHATHAQHLYESLEDIDRYFYSHHQLLVLSTDESNWQENAKSLVHLALDYENKAKPERAGEVFCDVSEIYLRFGDLEKAEDYARDALLLLPVTQPAHGKLYRILATCNFASGEVDDGRTHLDKAISLFKQFNMLHELDEAVTFMCERLKSAGQFEEAYYQMISLKGLLVDNLTAENPDSDTLL
ncbi:MAG: helix-turn-helix domain-containing protein [Halobacteriota archaeon]